MLLQGLGAAGPRSVLTALIRDKYSGRAMAQVMSFIMTVFILVPVIAPAFGQFILLFSGWRAIFGAFLILAAVTLVWFALRQPETLPTANADALVPAAHRPRVSYGTWPTASRSDTRSRRASSAVHFSAI